MDEWLRQQLAERLKAVEVRLESLGGDNKEIKQEIVKLKMAQLDLHYTLFGGPKPDDVGLLEKFRKLLYRFGIAILLATGCVAFAGKLISPIYDKLVSDWAYNSVSERWLRDKSQPKVTHYTIKVKPNEG